MVKYNSEASFELFDGYSHSNIEANGNTLEINFALDLANVTGDGNCIVISKEYADERGVVTKTYPQSEWTAQGASVRYVSFSVSAKDMNDKLTVTVYNAAGEVVSTTIDSMGSYAGRQTADVYLYDAILAFGKGAYNYFHG